MKNSKNILFFGLMVVAFFGAQSAFATVRADIKSADGAKSIYANSMKPSILDTNGQKRPKCTSCHAEEPKQGSEAVEMPNDEIHLGE